MEDFIQELNLPYEGKMSGGDYIIQLKTSNDFSKLYNMIATNKDFNLDRNSMATTNNAAFTFYNDWYEIKFTADFSKDIYRMVVSER